MAITIDQFLRELTERRFLSGEEEPAFRLQLTNNARERTSKDSDTIPQQNGSRTAMEISPLILCKSQVLEKLQEDASGLVFAANRLADDAEVAIHVLSPQGTQFEDPTAETVHEDSPQAPLPLPRGIVDVGRHGEMLCVCSQSLEAETLEEVIIGHGPLPVELASDTLLQTVRLLDRMQQQGLVLETISPDQLLLDEAGCVHLTGHQPAQFLSSSHCGCEETSSSPDRLFNSLGVLYEFLQTGQTAADDSFREPLTGNEQESFSRSAELVGHRLLEREAAPKYPTWGKLIEDLETLLKGEEVSLPQSGADSLPELPEVPTDPKPTPVAEGQPSSDPQPTHAPAPVFTGRQMLYAIVIVGGLLMTAIAFFNS